MKGLRLALLTALLLAPTGAFADDVVATFQLGGILWEKDYAPYTINRYPCVAPKIFYFCGPNLMTTDGEGFLAWAKFVRGPEAHFKKREMYLGEEVLSGIVFDETIRVPELVFYWKDGFDRNLYVRIPWPSTVKDLDRWIKKEARAQWEYIVEHRGDVVFDPAERRRHSGQFTYATLAMTPAHALRDPRIVFAPYAPDPPAKPAPAVAPVVPPPTLKEFIDLLKREQQGAEDSLDKDRDDLSDNKKERLTEDRDDAAERQAEEIAERMRGHEGDLSRLIEQIDALELGETKRE